MIDKLLDLAGLTEREQFEAICALHDAQKRTKGLFWHKLKTRYLMAERIAKAMRWDDERLIDAAPEWDDYDIAPMVNITGHGDNAPWSMTIQGGRPQSGQWLNSAPQSVEYMKAVASNYWLPGTHPRSTASRKAWYRRNAGEYRAWRLGVQIDLSHGVRVWHGRADGVDVTVYRCGKAWQLEAARKVLGRLHIKTRIGYEITNVVNVSTGEQMWYPIQGHELRAPLTWSHLPVIL